MTDATCYHIYLQNGRPALSDGSGRVIGGLVCREGFDGPARVFKWEGVDVRAAARAAWSLKVIRRLETELGIEHWWRDGYSERVMSTPRPGEKEKQKKLPTIYGLCSEFTMRADICNAPILDEGASRCRRHAAAERKKAASNERWRQQREAWSEQHDRDDRQTADLRELWNDVCDLYEIEPERRGSTRVEGGRARVDYEILQRLLITLIEKSS